MTNNNLHGAPILVLIQAVENTIHPVSIKVIETACSLGIQDKRKVYGVLLCKDLTPELQIQLKQSGLAEVFVYQNKLFDSFVPEIHIDLIEECIENLKPDIVLACATPEGRAISSMLASKLKTGVTADCTELSFDSEGNLLQTRPAFGGNIMAKIITPTARPQISTLRFGTQQNSSAKTETKITKMDAISKYILPKGYLAQWVDRTSIDKNSNSRIIFALGGGIREKNDIAMFAEIAQKLNADVMCSRALVDRGWFSRNHQIGLSGQTVSPRLLITLGISGSLQFLAGVQNTQRICSVTLDENAPILKVADCPIVGDIYEIIAQLESIVKV